MMWYRSTRPPAVAVVQRTRTPQASATHSGCGRHHTPGKAGDTGARDAGVHLETQKHNGGEPDVGSWPRGGAVYEGWPGPGAEPGDAPTRTGRSLALPPGTQQDSFPWVHQVEPPQPYPVGTGRGHTPRLTRTPPATVRDRPPDGPSQGPHTGSRTPPPTSPRPGHGGRRTPAPGGGRQTRSHPHPTPTTRKGAPPRDPRHARAPAAGGGGRGRWEGAHTNRPTACVCIQCDEHTNTRRQWEDAAPPTAALRGSADGGGGLMGGWKILQAQYIPT